MFAKTIIDSDAFLDMPLSTQALYFHLSMRADDEGFINNPKRIQRTIGASDDDMKVLLAKNFIISFETGVIVIKHWKIHNYIRGDRLRKTAYKEERSMLEIKDNGAYTLNSELNDFDDMSVSCQSNVSIGKVSIGKDSIDKVSIGKDILSEKSDNNTTLSDDIKDIIDYLNLKNESNYRPNTTKTRTLIKSRLKEGFTVDDFKTVIDKKVSQWKSDTKMSAYLRPETLFGTKFEGYLNEKIVENNNQTRDLFKELRDC